MAVKFDKFEEFAEDMDILQSLGDNPNADDGLSSDELKAKFDEGGLKIKAYLLTMIGQMNRMVDDLNRQFEDTGDFLMGGTMQGALDINGNSLTGLAEPVNNTDAVRKMDLDDAYIAIAEVQTAADKAQASANNARAAANNAQTAADNAQTTADGKVAKTEASVTLATGKWVDKKQTVEVSGVTKDNTVIIGPSSDSYVAYCEAGVRDYEQGSGTITFICEDVPSVDITIDMAIFDGNATSGSGGGSNSPGNAASLFDIVTEMGANRFDSNAAVNGYYVNPNDGNLMSNASYATTDFIPVTAGEVITYQYGQATVVLGRTIGTMSFLASYDKDKTYLSGERNLTSYTVPDGVAFIRFSSAGLMSGTNVAVVASADKMDYEPYEKIVHYKLKPEVHNDEHIREIAEEVISNADIDTSKMCAAPIVEGVTASRFEIESTGDKTIGEVTVPEGSRAERIRVWGKNHFHNDKGATVTTLGVTVEWDAENQEFVFNGTTASGGDIKLINPFDLDWVPGAKYNMSVRKVGGTATLGTGTSGTTYAWGIFQDNAAKYIRGSTANAEFVDLYSFTSTAYELDANRTHVLYFQCWMPGTVFNNYRVKIQIEKGDTVTDWEPYHGKTVAIADASGQMLYQGKNHIMVLPSTETVAIGQIVDTKDYVDRHAGIHSLDELPDVVITNAYDKDNTGYDAGKFLWNGGVSDNAAYFASGFIAVEPDTDYAFFGSDSTPAVRSICEYDVDQTFISGMSHQNVATIHTTANTYFLRVCCYNGAQQSLTVRKGTMATGYTPRHSYKIPGEQVSQDVTAIDAYLPKHIYCAVGRTIELYNNQVCLQADKYHLKWHCSVGKALKRKFSITGTTALVGDHTLKLGIYNDRLEEVWAGSTTLHIVSNVVADAHAICPVGDSLTNAKAWLPEVVNLSGDKISYVGTYNWNLDDADGNARSGGHEGRSGFTGQAYINGATYSYGGETSPNVFWDGKKFSWASYKTKTGLNPDAVQIFLGTNGIANDNTVNAGYIKQMVDAIRADDTNVKIFVCNTLYRSSQDGIGVQVGNDGYAATSGVWKYNEDKKVMDLMKRLDAMLDGYENLWMVNLALTHDSEYNFGAVETPVNPRAAQTEFMPIESVHPQTQGYFQMADVMFSAICNAYAE